MPPTLTHESRRSPPLLLMSSTQPTPSNSDPPPLLVLSTWLINSDPPPLSMSSTQHPSNPDSPPPSVSSPGQATPSNFNSPQFSTMGGCATLVLITNNTPNPLQQTPNLNVILNMIRLDPSLQNIDPILLAAVRATLPSALNVINASSVGKLVQLVTASRLTLYHEGRIDPMKDECHYQVKH